MFEQSDDQKPASSQSSKAELSKSALAVAFDIGGLMMLLVMSAFAGCQSEGN